MISSTEITNVLKEIDDDTQHRLNTYISLFRSVRTDSPDFQELLSSMFLLGHIVGSFTTASKVSEKLNLPIGE